MIYTVTLNPSIDYVVQIADFRSGKLNRTQNEIFLPGGKGNNVSMVLENLGVESTALGFAAGFTGSEIESMLQQRGIHTDYIRLPEGNSRVNVKLHSLSNACETEVNGNGPDIPEEALEKLIKKLGKLKKGDTVSIAIPYLLLYAVVRFCDEFLRGDTYRGIWGPFSTSQWISLAIIVVTVIYIFLKRSRYSAGTA